MPQVNLVDYIQDQTQQGVTAQTLRESLMAAGWPELEIENALHDVAAGLHPATPGSSIHEDLAQVRGMVAHLAARVKTIEESMLPSGFIGPDHELSAASGNSFLVKLFSLIGSFGAMLLLAFYATQQVQMDALSSFDLTIFLAAGGIVSFLAALMALHWHRIWGAFMFAASACAIWLADIGIAWVGYHLISWMVALGLVVLVGVLTAVFGLWVERMRRS